MEEVAVRISKSVAKLGRDLKAWPVWGWIKDTIEAFKRTMPLITDLRNPAMRKRHWDQLMVRPGLAVGLGRRTRRRRPFQGSLLRRRRAVLVQALKP